MGFYKEDLAATVRGKCNIARQIFAYAANAPEFALNESDYVNVNKLTFMSLVNPIEYSAGVVYVIATNGRGAIPFTASEKSTGGADIITSSPVLRTQAYDTIYDFSGASLLRGYLQPMTLAEYCTTVNIPQTATRVYTTGYSTSSDYRASRRELVDVDTKRPYNEFATYADKIVPTITWYYTDKSGTRVSDRQYLTICYIYTANRSTYNKYKQEQVPFGGGYVDKFITQNYQFNAKYYGVCAPYVPTVSSPTTGCVNLNGILYSTWANKVNSIKLSANNNRLYTTLSVGWGASATVSGTIYKVVDGAPYVNAGVSTSTLTGRDIPVFDSVDDIINLFADFGVTVTTDWDEVLSPEPTPEESAEPNPDPSDREIPSNPDNTTDTTPIEGAYITPSTFAQSCVYTPTTTRDFLRWVCNNTVNIDNWTRLFANPVDVITGINLYNLDIVAHDSTRVQYNEQTDILGVTTNIPNYSMINGYNNIIDGGTLHLDAYYGNYADFTSMTYQAFLPFVGFVALRACDVVNRTLHLYYAVDFATGAAVAFLNSDDKLIYTSPCTVAGKIPISTSDKNSQMINNTLSVIGGIGGLLGGIASGNVGGGVGSFLSGAGGLQLQTNYANKGSLSSVNMYKLLPAFVERTRYDLFLPSDDSNYINARYQSYAGAPSTRFDTLVNCVNAGGFIQSDVVYLTSQTATETEKQQIIDLIKSGIYL